MRYAVINQETFMVVNVIIWDDVSNWTPPTNHIVIASDSANIGDIYHSDSQKFINQTIKGNE